MNVQVHRKGYIGRTGAWFALLILIVVLTACYPGHYRTVSYDTPLPKPEVIPGPPQPPPTQVYFYPRGGQTTEQQSRDHYECYNWAIDKTGFDPGQSSMPAEQRVRVVPMPPPGHDTAAFAIAGAVLGALVGGPRHAAGGALIGASAGAVAGATSDAARQEEARRAEERYADRDRARNERMEAKTLEFRRAMSACLEGRGYSVR